jgi:hypothetical protein
VSNIGDAFNWLPSKDERQRYWRTLPLRRKITTVIWRILLWIFVIAVLITPWWVGFCWIVVWAVAIAFGATL